MKFKTLSEKETSIHLLKHTSFCTNIDMINKMAYDMVQSKYKEYLNNFKSKVFLFFKRKPQDFDTFVLTAMPYCTTIKNLENKNYIFYQYGFYCNSKNNVCTEQELDLLMLAAKYSLVRFKYNKYINRINTYAEKPYQLHVEDIINFEFFDESTTEIMDFITKYNTP